MTWFEINQTIVNKLIENILKSFIKVINNCTYQNS